MKRKSSFTLVITADLCIYVGAKALDGIKGWFPGCGLLIRVSFVTIFANTSIIPFVASLTT